MLHALTVLLDHPRLTLAAWITLIAACLGVGAWAHISDRNDTREESR